MLEFRCIIYKFAPHLFTASGLKPGNYMLLISTAHKPTISTKHSFRADHHSPRDYSDPKHTEPSPTTQREPKRADAAAGLTYHPAKSLAASATGPTTG